MTAWSRLSTYPTAQEVPQIQIDWFWPRTVHPKWGISMEEDILCFECVNFPLIITVSGGNSHRLGLKSRLHNLISLTAQFHWFHENNNDDNDDDKKAYISYCPRTQMSLNMYITHARVCPAFVLSLIKCNDQRSSTKAETIVTSALIISTMWWAADQLKPPLCFFFFPFFILPPLLKL